jgi:hypothetical protein
VSFSFTGTIKWSIGLYSLVLLLAALLAPAFAATHHFEWAGNIYQVFALSCHQNPSSTFWLMGYPAAVCCRCLGIYLGSFLQLPLGKTLWYKGRPLGLLLALFAFGLGEKPLEALLFSPAQLVAMPLPAPLLALKFLAGVALGLACWDVMLMVSVQLYLFVRHFFMTFLNRNAINKSVSLGLLGVLLGSSLLSAGLSLVPNASSMANAASQVASGSVVLPAGTAVSISLMNQISSKEASIGTSVDFRVTGDIKQGGKIVVANGSIGHAQVVASRKATIVGQEGELTVSDFHVNAVDGTRIPLVATLNQVGTDKMVVSIVAAILCLPFILLKGGDAVVPAGTQKTVYTSMDATITP